MDKIYSVIIYWQPHNGDSGCDCVLFSTLSGAKKWLEQNVDATIEEYTKVDENGYQYCSEMEYVKYNEDKTSCSLLTEREDYMNWSISIKSVDKE